MDHPIVAILDANVLYAAPLRDLLIRLAQGAKAVPLSNAP